jgi:hypothetical protein
MIKKDLLKRLYVKEGRSVQAIGNKLGYSRRGVKYWMDKYNIPTRSVSDAIYLWHNPNGDPFKFRKPKNREEERLFGMGLGLYWGEGTRSSQHAIRLGNTDPALLNMFIKFLITIFNIKKSDLHFGLQIFTDINAKEALDFWVKELKVNKTQFQKPVVTISGSIGTYRKKSKYGVVTVHYNNKKARDILIKLLPM